MSTNLMIVSSEDHMQAQISINNQPIQTVSNFKRLETMLNDKWDYNDELRM